MEQELMKETNCQDSEEMYEYGHDPKLLFWEEWVK